MVPSLRLLVSHLRGHDVPQCHLHVSQGGPTVRERRLHVRHSRQQRQAGGYVASCLKVYRLVVNLESALVYVVSRSGGEGGEEEGGCGRAKGLGGAATC